jgi:hypothetical protein
VGLLLTLEILFTPINPIVQMQINGIGNVPGPHKQILSFPRLMWLKWEEVREVWISVLWCTSETPETPILIEDFPQNFGGRWGKLLKNKDKRI